VDVNIPFDVMSESLVLDYVAGSVDDIHVGQATTITDVLNVDQVQIWMLNGNDHTCPKGWNTGGEWEMVIKRAFMMGMEPARKRIS
jgi:hypothetical protein